MGEIASNLLRWGLASAASSAALAVLVAAVTFPLRRTRPAVVHALWLLVLLKLLAPPLWNVTLRQPKESRAAQPTEVEDVRVVHLSAEELAALDAADVEPEAPGAAEPPAPARETTDWWALATTAAAVAWACGSGACLLLIVTRSLQFRRLLCHAAPAPADVVRQTRAVAARLGVDDPPAVCFVPGAVCPMLYAFVGKARLLLPRGLWDRLTGEQRDTLIAHELAHYRRRDHWVRLVEVAATVAQWWNPVLWLARRGLREAEEQCCDAWVVWSMPGAVRDYMSAILEAVEYVSEPNTDGGTPRFARAAVPALASGLGEFRRLERRLHMIRENESPRRLGRLGCVAVLLAAGGLLPLAPTLAQVEPPKPEASNREDHREVVVTQSEAVSSVSGSTDVAPKLELRSDPVEKTATIGGDVVVRTQTEPETTSRIVDGRTGNVVEARGNKIMRITSGSEIDKARAEVEQARANLEVATRRLKELEMRGKGGDDAKIGWRVESEKIASKDAWAKKEPKAKYVKGEGGDDLKANLKAKEDSDQERRMERLEQRMEKLDAILNELREMNQRQQSDKRNEKPTNYAPAKS